MSERDFSKDREVCNEATPGPWHTSNPHGGPKLVYGPDSKPIYRLDRHMDSYDESLYVTADIECDWNDVDFIAAAREGWPAALDEIDRLRALLKEKESE